MEAGELIGKWGIDDKTIRAVVEQSGKNVFSNQNKVKIKEKYEGRFRIDSH